MPFDFFGLGQPRPRPNQQDDQDQGHEQELEQEQGHELQVQQDQQNQLNEQEDNAAWEQWPVPPQQLLQPMVGQDLNLPPQMMEIDLNTPGQDEDNP
jgi:hypothetical protein